MNPITPLGSQINESGSDDLIAGEDPSTFSSEEALHWKQVYAELMTLEDGLLDTVRQSMRSLTSNANGEIARTNLPILIDNTARYRRRFEYWDRRCKELSPGAVS